MKILGFMEFTKRFEMGKKLLPVIGDFKLDGNFRREYEKLFGTLSDDDYGTFNNLVVNFNERTGKDVLSSLLASLCSSLQCTHSCVEFSMYYDALENMISKNVEIFSWTPEKIYGIVGTYVKYMKSENLDEKELKTLKVLLPYALDNCDCTWENEIFMTCLVVIADLKK